MIYVKSVLAGVGAVVAMGFVIIVAGIAGAIIYTARNTTPESGSIGWDLISLWWEAPAWLWILFALCFCAGFYWKYHRLTK